MRRNGGLHYQYARRTETSELALEDFQVQSRRQTRIQTRNRQSVSHVASVIDPAEDKERPDVVNPGHNRVLGQQGMRVFSPSSHITAS